MKAFRTILTHFSQRYPTVPPLPAIGVYVCVIDVGVCECEVVVGTNERVCACRYLERAAEAFM